MVEPLVIKPPARLDTASSPLFEQEVVEKIRTGAQSLIMDFSDVSYISSAGLRVLLIAAKRLKAANGRIALCGVQENSRKVLEISGFIQLLPLYPSLEEALAT